MTLKDTGSFLDEEIFKIFYLLSLLLYVIRFDA